MINLRTIRHDAIDAIDAAKKDKEIGEDDAKRYIAQIEEAMSQARSKVESTAKAKEAEIMTV